MIILDTNVVSAVIQTKPDRAVAKWLNAQPTQSLWLTAITVFEIRLGIETLARGRRREQLEDDFARSLAVDFDERVLPVDAAAAHAAGVLAAQRRRAGKSVEIRDTLIAGIVIARNAQLATGNVRHFDDLTTKIINPWNT